MTARYVWRDLVRNPRRTLASLVGITLGVGLFSSVLFFIDGSGASLTKRALAPLALDVQRVLTSPLGGGVRFTERLASTGSLRRGQTTKVTLTVANRGRVPANEVVVNDEPPPPLAYVTGKAAMDGRPLARRGAGNPLAQGAARTGLNIGTLGARKTVTLSYSVRATRPVPHPAALELRGTISTRENVVPSRANTATQVGLRELAAKVSRIPGVAAADGLAFADLPAGSLRAGGATIPGQPVRVFGLDGAYQRHYPSIRLVAAGFAPGTALLSAEASRALGAGPGAHVQLSIPGRRAPLTLRVGGVADLSQARPLFYSRQSTNLEDFLYVPNSVVVDPATFRDTIIPAYRAATAARGSGLKSRPLLELDVLVQRSRLQSDPATALAQTTAIARAIRRIAPNQDYLLDNASNTLQVARDDARVAKRMFLFLGLPGALLAAFLAAYGGSILASAQRREQANLRIRGAHRGHLVRMLSYRTLALAGLGSVVGTGLGLLSVLAVLGRSSLFEAATTKLVISALIGVAAGMATTALALYIPGRRSLSREISQERGEMVTAGERPAWRRLRLDFILLGLVLAGEIVALRAGAFNAPAGSVYTGQGVSLPSYLLLAPIGAWIAGVLLSVRVFEAFASRTPVPAPPRFGRPISGTLGRSLRRRSWALAGGVIAVGLVVAFGASLALFTTTYDAAKAADARFVVGSDLRITPSVLSTRPHPPSFAARLEVPGVAAATPLVFKLGNSILIGPFNEDRENLAAINARSFRRVAALSDSFFPGSSAAGAMAALRADPRGVLVNTFTAGDLQVTKGDRVKVLLARGTRQQSLQTMHVVGVFRKFPGFPQGTNLVANLDFYRRSTGSERADFFLARAADRGHAGLARATAGVRTGPGRSDRLSIASTETALDKDQSSLTALNVHGLIDLDSLYTLLMTAASVAIFVFGLMLQRRREYITLRAQGMRTREIQALVLGESALVAASGLMAGILVGTGMAWLLVHVLRPLFVLDPTLTFSAGGIGTLAGLSLTAALGSALAATAMLRRLRPTELLRET